MDKISLTRYSLVKGSLLAGIKAKIMNSHFPGSSKQQQQSFRILKSSFELNAKIIAGYCCSGCCPTKIQSPCQAQGRSKAGKFMVLSYRFLSAYSAFTFTTTVRVVHPCPNVAVFIAVLVAGGEFY